MEAGEATKTREPMGGLKRIRELQGLSQRDLANLSGVNASSINQIETGARSPSVTTLKKLAHAMGVGLADFFTSPRPNGGPEDPPAPPRPVRSNRGDRELSVRLDAGLAETAGSLSELSDDEVDALRGAAEVFLTRLKAEEFRRYLVALERQRAGDS